jgi:hypothetical protein
VNLGCFVFAENSLKIDFSDSFNWSVSASDLKALGVFYWLGHFARLHSHAHPLPVFCNSGLYCVKPLFGLQNVVSRNAMCNLFGNS